MADPRLDRLQGILLILLPGQGGNVPRAQLRPNWVKVPLAAREAATQPEFAAVREIFSKLRNRPAERSARGDFPPIAAWCGELFSQAASA